MKTKIATTFGLALMLGLGIFGAMLALNLFSASEVRAEGHVGVDVTALAHTPDKPGLGATYTVTFTTNQDLFQGDTITVVVDKSIGVPDSIATSSVIINTAQSTGGSSNPTLVTKSKCSAANLENTGCSGSGDHIITLTLGDTRPADATVQKLNRAAGHKISFASSAGFTNPTTAESPAGDADHWIVVITSQETNAQDIDETTEAGNVNWISTPRYLTISPSSGAIGTTSTVTGTGFASGGTATVYIDANTNGVRDAGEAILATSDANISGGSFTASFTVDERFGTGTTTINAHTHINNTTADSATTTNDVTFSVSGSLTTDKSEVTRGETITLKFRNFGAGTVTAITFGGAGANLSALSTAQRTIGTGASLGSLDLEVTVPTTTSLGTQQLKVTGVSKSINISIVGAPVTLNPSTAVPDQKITVSGTGFTTGGAATIATGSNTCTASGIVITGTVCWSSSHTLTTLDDSGNFVLTYQVPDDTPMHAAGTYELVVIDSANRTGSAILTVPARTLTVDTAESRRGSLIGFSGAGFPAKATVTITYRVSSTSTLTVGTVAADEQGNYAGTFTVPTTALIPSTNTITAAGSGQGGGDTVAAVNVTSSHKVPGAVITINPTSTPSGKKIEVTGVGFPGFSTVTGITVGNVESIPTPNPATDIEGKFTADVLVPALSVGTKAVVATAGGVSASTSISIEATPVVVVIAPPVVSEGAPAEVFSEVAALDPGMQLWGFTGGVWGFYDASLAAEHPANDLAELKVGDGVWVFNSTDADIIGTVLSRSLTFGSGWSLKGL